MGATSYDRIPYSSFPYRQAHPDQLAVCARLYGLEPPPPQSARVLDLGCGAGGHLLALCAAWPGVSAVGVDVATTAIAAGREAAAGAGIENLRLEVADLRDLADGRLGEFDYVVAHGIYSWVAPDVRHALLAALRAHLAPGGLGYLSFNAQPGGHLRSILREASLWHARAATTEAERITGARELLELLHEWRASDDPEDPYGGAFADLLPRFLQASDSTLAHDLLSPDSEPSWYADFAADVERHGLRAVGEARLVEPSVLPRDVGLREAIRTVAGGDAVAREQIVDLLGLGRFRETVVAHAGARPAGEVDPAVLRELRFIAPDLDEPGVPPELARVIAQLAAARPLTTPFAELAAATGLEPPALEALLLEGLRRSLLTAWLCEPAAVPAGERARASALVRWQAAAGVPCFSLLHTVVMIDGAGAVLLGLLDGTRDAEALARDLSAAVGVRLTAQQVAANVESLARAGVLEA